MAEINEDYVFTILTADRCVKCLMCKSTGTIEDTFNENGEKVEKVEFIKGRRFDKDFIIKVLNGGRVKVQEFVFKGLNGLREDIMEIILYQLDGSNKEKVITTKYIKRSDGMCERIICDGESLTLRRSFEKLVNSYVPYRIYNFVLLFPGFLISETSEWKKGIKDNNYFLKVHSLGCAHVDFLSGQTWIVNKSDTVKDITYMIDPILVLDDLISGKSNLLERPEDLPSRKELLDEGDNSELNKIKKFVDTDTIRGRLRNNDKGIPFSNGRPFGFVPDDYMVMYL